MYPINRVYITLIYLSLYVLPALSQGEIDTTKKIFYRNEKTFLLGLNSNGYGIDFRKAKRLNYFEKKLFEIWFAEIRDKKEIKLTNTYYPSKRSYVFGKKNIFWTIRVGRGYQKELYSKRDKGGIAIRYFYTYGISLGVTKPVYYEEYKPEGIEISKFEEVNDHNDIIGKASFFRGFDKLKPHPGLYTRFGMNLEYSNIDVKINSLECGIAFDIFPYKIPLIAEASNHLFFFTMFVGYRFGRVIDPTKKADRKKIRELRKKMKEKE